MSGPLGFSHQSHLSYPSEHTPSIPIAARVSSPTPVIPAIGKEKLIPIQQAFRSLTQEPLFKKSLFNAAVASKDPQYPQSVS